MPLADLPGIGQEADLNQVKDYLIGFRRMMNDFLNHLDTLNVDELDANVINAGVLNAALVTIKAALTGLAYIQLSSAGMVINDGTKNTFSADVNGNVTMTSATIQSAAGYPKIVMDPTGNLLGIYASATNYIDFNPITGTFTAPTASWVNGGSSADVYLASSLFNIQTTANLDITAPSGAIGLKGASVTVPNWSKLINFATNQTLQSALDAKANLFSGFTGTVFVAATSGGPTTKALNINQGIVGV